ncbi:hypothetical protein BC834DRAFT_903461 [Gloeopeniophorella convolvens]|nr:hypothetical protein BC834DRAFT_903461 [Gloeopeniophorella convolvens]
MNTALQSSYARDPSINEGASLHQRCLCGLTSTKPRCRALFPSLARRIARRQPTSVHTHLSDGSIRTSSDPRTPGGHTNNAPSAHGMACSDRIDQVAAGPFPSAWFAGHVPEIETAMRAVCAPIAFGRPGTRRCSMCTSAQPSALLCVRCSACSPRFGAASCAVTVTWRGPGVLHARTHCSRR